MRAVQFIAMICTGLALVPVGAHIAALPNKIHLAQTDYFITQTVYRGWYLFGVVLIAAIVFNAWLAVLMRRRGLAFTLVIINLACLSATLAIFFAFTYPANVATDNWTAIPGNWEDLRRQWELSHAANAVITFAGFCALTLSLLVARD